MEHVREAMRMADYRETFTRMDTLKSKDYHEEVKYAISAGDDSASKDSSVKVSTIDTTIQFRNSEETLKDYLSQLSIMEMQIQAAIHQKIDSLIPINYTQYEIYLSEELQNRGISAPYQLQVIQPDATDSVLYASPDTINVVRPWRNAAQIEFPFGLNGSYYKISLSPDKIVLKQIAGILISSLLLVVVILGAFIYLLYTILRQKTVEELKTDFTNNMTHELKTPISVAYAANDVLLNHNHNVSEKQQKYLTIIREQLTHLSGLVEQILTLSVENRKSFRLHPETIYVAKILPSLIEQYKLKTGEPLSITTEIPDDLHIIADPTHLYNMLSNLIENAIKYSEEKPCSISIKSVRLSDETCLTVSDKGIGISETNQKRIFDKFFRVPNGNLHNVKGYGLGLYYVNDMMSKHGGYVSVKSTLGKGSTFTLHFKNK